VPTVCLLMSFARSAPDGECLLTEASLRATPSSSSVSGPEPTQRVPPSTAHHRQRRSRRAALHRGAWPPDRRHARGARHPARGRRIQIATFPTCPRGVGHGVKHNFREAGRSPSAISRSVRRGVSISMRSILQQLCFDCSVKLPACRSARPGVANGSSHSC
jgi:hypothetical protein